MIVKYRSNPKMMNLALRLLLAEMAQDYDEVTVIEDPGLSSLVEAVMPDKTIIRSSVEYVRYKKGM